MLTAQLILLVLGTYTGIGLAFAASFVTWGIGQIDPAARGASWAFRLLILPGTAALWPLIARRWMNTPRTGGRA